MANVRFKSNAPNHTRELSAHDLKQLGVEGDTKKFTISSGEVKEIDDAIADVLIKELPGEFEIVKDYSEGEPLEPATQLDETVPGDKTAADSAGSGGSSTGANTRDGAGARTARSNR